MANLKRNIEHIRKARGISEDQLSVRLGIGRDDLAKLLDKPPKRKEGLVRKLSHELLVPEILLFADSPNVRETDLPDFRLSNPAPGGYSREALRWIDFAKDIQSMASASAPDISGPKLSEIIDAGAKIPDAANQLRKYIGFDTDTQIGFENARLMFSALRQKIEAMNVFVLQLSFPEIDGTGFCLSGKVYDVVAINTRHQSAPRRTFTLAHELYHCLLGQSGVSDFRAVNNAIERHCNSFAAYFLAPDNLVQRIAERFITGKTLDLNELRAVANTLNISMYATLLRLIEVGIYSDDVVEQWQAYINTGVDPEGEQGRGGRRVEEWKYKLAKYGFKFATVFGELKRRGQFDELEFYKLSGIKPKYQNDYIENGTRGRPEDAVVDEEGDDA